MEHFYYAPSPSAEAAAGGGGGPTYTLVADGGTFTLSGGTANLVVGRKLAAAGGTYTLSGGAAGLVVGRKLAAAGGTFSLTGGDATLSYSGAGAATYTLVAAGGTYALTGGAAALKVSRSLTAQGGTFTLSGGIATLTYSGGAAASPPVYGGKVDDDWHHFKRKWDEEDEDAERKAVEAARKAVEAVRQEVAPTVRAAPAPVRQAFVAPPVAADAEDYAAALERQIERVKAARVMADRTYRAAATRYIAAMEAEAQRLREFEDEMEEEEAIMSLLLDD